MVNKQDLEYIKAVKAKDYEKADEIASQIMNKFTKCLSGVSVNNFEMPFFTAAIKLAGETMYNSMDKMHQKVCDALMQGTENVMIAKPAKEDENNE